MNADLFLALLVFAFVSAVTPGPNNFMLLASGVNFGFLRTVPHMLGIWTGFTSLLLGVGLGLGAVLAMYPALHTVLKLLGATYLLYLAWRIAMSRTLSTGSSTSARPLTFMEAAAFQWVNPKAWVMAVTAMSIYTIPQAVLLSQVQVVSAFALVNLPIASAWTGFGTVLRSFLSDPRRLKWFNISMGLALALTLWPMLR